MYLQSDGSDRKIISQQTDYRRHLPWMNAGLCFILKYILLRQTLYRGEHDVYSESIFSRITDYHNTYRDPN